jgi:hypothetical protein
MPLPAAYLSSLNGKVRSGEHKFGNTAAPPIEAVTYRRCHMWAEALLDHTLPMRQGE